MKNNKVLLAVLSISILLNIAQAYLVYTFLDKYEECQLTRIKYEFAHHSKAGTFIITDTTLKNGN